MRVLGVDPGLTRCGLGIVETGAGRSVSLISVSVATSSPEAETPDRLVLIADAIDAAIDRHRPDAVAVERVFAQHNVRTVMGTAQVSGLVMVAARRRGLPVALYTPSEVKAAVSGSGRADKAQVGFMVAKLLGLDAVPAPADAADSLAIALTHALRYSATPGAGTATTTAQRTWAEAERAARRRG
ncbi:crossover junction endodeoxyribonuclease RuvC [Demequina sp.]|uniref:crossover junction endodeoxyribonuclease RuvC n=1 Tax=Demequina sp. TaxID=2050685 RepID=UPI0025BF7439|nr:crossover junction endodeoxyribonuclease RuvC [Demequina sp.]